jgi:hypothetical protein
VTCSTVSVSEDPLGFGNLFKILAEIAAIDKFLKTS